MSLKHDPSAIRYASIQEAYGTTWTLDKVEDDGAQVWKNTKGQTAMVQKAVEQIRQQLPPRPVWAPIDTGQWNESFGKVELNSDSVDSLPNQDLSMPQPDPPYGAEYGNAATRRISSVKTNESNHPGVITVPTSSPYVGERKTWLGGVTREWNGTRWVEVNKAGDRKISADASREWEYDGAEWKRVR